jgi:serine/threonine protein phosphatase 1
MSRPAVARFPANTAGRDFVIGDVHGAYTQVANAMRAVGFQPAVDRMFVVGDSIDRGPQSLRARRFLELPYVHAARGNHEDFWLECYEGNVTQPEIVELLGRRMNMGVQWWLDAPPDERDALVALFAQMPLAIEIETPRGLVGLVHAEVPIGMDWQTFTAGLERGDERIVQSALWGRTRIGSGDESGVPGIDRLFVGHTPQWAGARRLGNVYAIDTGAIYGALEGDRAEGRLTLADVCMKTGSLAEAAERTAFDMLVDLYTETPEPSQPFGQYAQERARA